jgi:hypothetical protein
MPWVYIVCFALLHDQARLRGLRQEPAESDSGTGGNPSGAKSGSLLMRATGKPSPLVSLKFAEPDWSSAGPGREDQLRAPPENIPPHPTHNRKEIIAFVVVVLVSCAACFALSRVRRSEMLALYVIVLGPLLGLLAISIFRTVRFPRCRLGMDLVRTTEIAGRKWEVFRCQQCHGEWRVEKPVRPVV